MIVPGREAPADTAARNRTKRAREHFQLGLALERQGVHVAAIAAYDVAVRLDPTLPEAHFRMGKLFLTRDEVREAARHFAAEVQRHPRNLLADRELGLALARLGDSAHAVTRLERVTRLRPDDDENWRALGFAYTTAGRHAQAERALRRAIALPPKRAIEHRDLGVLLASVGREGQARGEYRKAIALDRRDASVWLNLGNLERRANRLEQALAAYVEAEKQDSNFAYAFQGQIGVLLQLERHAEAGQTYRRWIKLKPDDHTARLEAVRHFNEAGRSDIALELARDGVRRQPKSADARVILGIANQYSGQVRTALDELRTAQSLYSNVEGRSRVEVLVRTMRAGAPDSLRALFEADSLAHAPPDTSKAPARGSAKAPR